MSSECIKSFPLFENYIECAPAVSQAIHTLGMHTNIASLNAHHDELELILSIIKFDFQIIGITEHKISDLKALSNITISGYQNFVYTPTKSTHGGTGFM